MLLAYNFHFTKVNKYFSALELYAYDTIKQAPQPHPEAAELARLNLT